MKIIKEGDPRLEDIRRLEPVEFTCPYCDCVFEANNSEYDKAQYMNEEWLEVDWLEVDCPCCKRRITKG